MESRSKTICELEQVIIDAIEESQMKQVELARRSKVSQGLLSLFLEKDVSKRRTITLPIADRLCEALGLELVRTRRFNMVRGEPPKKFHFREGCNKERVRKYCESIIRTGRGKMVCEKILKELESGHFTEGTRDQLSKWVNPARREPKVEDIFQNLSHELFGYRIGRSDRTDKPSAK